MSHKQSAVELAKFVDKGVHVKLAGEGKGYDQLLNMVLDDAVEYLRDPEDMSRVTTNTRKLGLVVCRGTVVMAVSPTAGIEEIANPFTAQMQQPAE